MKKFLIGTIILVAIGLLAQPALSQAPCAPARVAIEMMSANHGESPAQAGIMDTGELIVLTHNEETGTWSMLVVNPTTNVACLVATGDSWHDAHKVIPDLADPS